MTEETFLGQIKVNGEWVDYSRGTEGQSAMWQAAESINRRVVDWIDKDRVLYGPCPRCGVGFNVPRGAISRLDNKTRVCDQCGRMEGLWQAQHPGEPMPDFNVYLSDRP